MPLRSLSLLAGLLAFATSAVAQVPNLPPRCDAAVARVPELWPPNHKMVDVAIADVVDPDGDPVIVGITSVLQDEPVGGAGATCPDAVVGSDAVSIRAERDGSGDGRVYHVRFAADDGRGGLCTGSVQVCVRHDNRPGATCGDQGALFESLAPDGCSDAPICGVAACVPTFDDVVAVCGVPLPGFVERRLERARLLLAHAEIAPDPRPRRLGRRAAKHLRRAAIVLGRIGGDACAAPALAAAACATCFAPPS